MLRQFDAVTDARPVAITRIGVGCAAIIISLENYATLTAVADDAIVNLPLLPFLPPPTPDALTIWLSVALCASVGLVLGLLSRAAAGAVAVLTTVALLWDQQTYSSHQVLLVLLSTYLACCNAGARWSLDAQVSGRETHVAYWPQLLIKTQISVLYFFAAVSKLNPVFLAGDVLAASLWVKLPISLNSLLSIAAICTELFIATALWFPRQRNFAFALGIGLHCSIVLFMNLPTVLTAFALLSLSTYPLFAARRLPVTDPLVRQQAGPVDQPSLPVLAAG